jgi:hypothetical protein
VSNNADTGNRMLQRWQNPSEAVVARVSSAGTSIHDTLP